MLFVNQNVFTAVFGDDKKHESTVNKKCKLNTGIKQMSTKYNQYKQTK